jgi:hypothetical protein
MKRRGTYKEILPGQWSCYPQTREAALIEDIVFFQPLPVTDPCPKPGHEPGSIIYSKTGIYRCCALRDACAFYGEAIDMGLSLSAQDSMKMGIDYYWAPDPGKFCGHPGKTTLDGKCWFCREEKLKARENRKSVEKAPKPLSPRKLAIINNQRWYMPGENDPCAAGHIALRRVTDGQCSECNRKEPKINELHPEMIIDRESARAMGFKVYRTGEPCPHGHTGWRYVSTNGCLDCLKGVK